MPKRFSPILKATIEICLPRVALTASNSTLRSREARQYKAAICFLSSPENRVIHRIIRDLALRHALAWSDFNTLREIHNE